MAGEDRNGRPVARAGKRYLVASGFVFAAFVLQLIAEPYVRPTPFLAFFGAVMAASRYGGVGPGLFAAILGAAIADFVFLPPGFAPAVAVPDLVAVTLFLLISTLICLLSEDLRRSRAALQRSNDELESRIEARTQDLVAAHRELLSAHQELERFSYTVAHDLQAPLRAIEGYAHVLSETIGPDDPGAARPLARIRASALRMKGLVDDLLVLAKVGRTPVRQERVNVSELAREVLATLERDPPDRGAEVVIDENLEIDADPGLVQLALSNLLSNAWKFTMATPAPRIEVRRAPAGAGFEGFLVRDNGAGFDPARAGRIFEPFERLHAQSEFPGSGVGLAIVQKVLDRHGGTVRAAGAIGEGATFTTAWPRRATSPH